MFNIGLTVTGVFTALILIIFSTFFSARLAQFKGRGRAWGLLGFIFNIPGLMIVCFLPSKRKDLKNTNPITCFTAKIPKLSKKTIYIFTAVICIVIIAVIAYDNIPEVIENIRYTNQVTNQSGDTQVTEISGKVETVYPGTESTYIITDSGNVYCLGKQILPTAEGEETGLIHKNAKKALSAGELCYILDKSGSLYVTKSETEAETILELVCDNVKDFEISEMTVAVIKNNGTLYMMGNNAYGQLGLGDKNERTELTQVIKNVKEVRCEATFTVALKTSGEVVAFGSNAYGQFGKEDKVFTSPTVIGKNIKDVSCGDGFIMLLNEDGNLSVCGVNDAGQLGNDSFERLTQFTEILSGITDIDSAKKSSFALGSDGKLYAFGQNTAGQLGLGNFENTNVPTVSETDVEYFVTSGSHTVITKTNGQVCGCGKNDWGQLGKVKSDGKFETVITVKQE